MTSTVQIVKQLPESQVSLQKVENLLRTKTQKLLTQAKPLAVHVASNVAANVAVVKMTGGNEVLPAATAAVLATVVSGVAGHCLGITHPIPKIALSGAFYTVAAKIMGERVTLMEAAVLGLATSAMAEIIVAYV
jgi:hypothetical protein